MPFQSQSQARGAFSGAFGPEMKEKASEFAHATPGGVKSLPQHVAKPRLAGRHPHRPKTHQPHSMNEKPAGPPQQDMILKSMMSGLNGGAGSDY